MSANRRTKGAGSIHERDGNLYARLSYTDPHTGKRKSIERKADSRAHAERLLKELHHEVKQPPVKRVPLFKDLAQEYAEKKLVAAEYVQGVKVRGAASWYKQRGLLKPLVAFFGSRPIDKIPYELLSDYKASRFNLTYKGTTRSLASVNRELSLLRAIFNYACRSGLLEKNPFTRGQGLIQNSVESKRERILSYEEEERLLAACTGRRAYMRPLIVMALDTALRKGEILKLRWNAIKWEHRYIAVPREITKDRRPRIVPITRRLEDALRAIHQDAHNEAYIFGLGDIKKAFHACRIAAGLEDLRFHDLRHTATTRMVLSGLPHTVVMSVTGHSQYATFRRYVNINENVIGQVLEAMDSRTTHTATPNNSQSIPSAPSPAMP